jgi:hypothetical protein
MITYDVVVTTTINVPGDGMTDQDLLRTRRAVQRDVEQVLFMYTGCYPVDLEVTVRCVGRGPEA